MSHRDNCPTREEAEAHGRRSFNNGLSRNPYDECEDAADGWRSGYRRAARRAEEEREEQEWMERQEYERQREEYERGLAELEQRAPATSGADSGQATAADGASPRVSS